MDDVININIARDFTENPGARYYTDGPFSGQEFRDKILDKYFNDPNDSRKIIIDLDGTEGYVSSFLEETFGGLVRLYTKKRVKEKITIVADKMKFFRDKAYEYIEKAKDPS